MLLILLDFAGQAAKVRLYFVCGPRIDLVGLAQEVERKQALAAPLPTLIKSPGVLMQHPMMVAGKSQTANVLRFCQKRSNGGSPTFALLLYPLASQ